jgi:hypothetical protein
MARTNIILPAIKLDGKHKSARVPFKQAKWRPVMAALAANISLGNDHTFGSPVDPDV